MRFNEEIQRFRSAFHVRNSKVFTIGVPGNHDIGFGKNVIPYAYNRYSETFGTLNRGFEIANHTIVALDTVSLSGRSDSTSYKNAEEYLQKLNETKETDPSRRILISHVPLYRHEDADCGPRRHTAPIRNTFGYQYQSNLSDLDLIQKDLSDIILESVNPSLVISGDDHDDCEFFHVLRERKVLEVRTTHVAYDSYIFLASR